MVKLENYPVNPGYSCLVSSVVNVLKYYNQDINDGIFFLLGEGFRLFDYNSNNLKSISDIHINQLSPMVVETFFKKVGISYQKKQYCSSINGCREKIEKDINSGSPLIFNISSASLVYSDLWVSGDREHYFTVIGINEDGVIISDIYLADVFGQHIDVYEGVLDFANFEQACLRYNWGYLDIDYEALKRAKLSFTKSYLLEQLELNLKYYLQGGNSYYCKLLQFADDICFFPEKFSNEEIKKDIISLSNKISHFGVLSSRRSFKMILTTLKEKYSAEITEEEISYNDRWHKICLNFSKVAFYDDFSPQFVKLSKKLKDLAEMEREYFESILNKLSHW
jgi:uncharacterized protein YlxP (DUF503 family)